MGDVGRAPSRWHRVPLLARLAWHFIMGDDCWIWTGAMSKGYGTIKVDGRQQLAHRVMYELVMGPIPDGMELDHLCRNPACVRPDHLEPVTSRENVLRGQTIVALNAAKKACVNGHVFDESNTYIGRTKYGAPTRVCRACHRVTESNRRRRTA